MTFQRKIINKCKYFIDIFDLQGLQEYYLELNNINFDYNINICHIFKIVFFYSCTKGRKPVIEWLIKLYETFDEITKIVLRQMFFYGKCLLIKNKHEKLIKWYNTTILPPIRCK